MSDLVKRINDLQRQVDNLIKPEVGRWVDWTPTVTQSIAVTATVTYARYELRGNTVNVSVRLDITSAGVIANVIIIGGVPTAISPANVGSMNVIGNGVVWDVSVARYQGSLIAVGVSDWRFQASGNSNYIGITPSFALASGDIISFKATYERA